MNILRRVHIPEVEKRDVSNTLYKLCIAAVNKLQAISTVDLTSLPANIAFDLCHEKALSRDLCSLNFEICHLEVFDKFLKLTHVRSKLHYMFQALEEHGTKLGMKLSMKFSGHAQSVLALENSRTKYDQTINLIKSGLRLGVFLSEAAWYDKAEKVFNSCLSLCTSLPVTSENIRLRLEISHHLLRVEAVFCNLQGAQSTFRTVETLIRQVTIDNSSELPPVNLSAVYTSISFYFFIRNDFKLSYDYSMLALRNLRDELPPRTRLDALRQASKSCVVKRQFVQARVLIEQALHLAYSAFGVNHVKFAETQHDYGFFLLNHDSIQDCVTAYETAYAIKKKMFMTYNVHVAVALEDLAYALYVYEYSTGQFTRAKQLAEEAIAIMRALLPADHIMLSSSQRVKALILEEIAIDESPRTESPLLRESEELHLSALEQGLKHFGEMNVQTAKHYGNLGRLYQSMQEFDKAELMHQKAIHIKETILGADDYEVGLSLGHLASLYNYHMFRYDEAILLYMRSIQISLKLFGPEYSGLEYDYRGLMHVYNQTNDTEKSNLYKHILANWRLRRLEMRLTPKAEGTLQAPRPIREVVDQVLAPL